MENFRYYVVTANPELKVFKLYIDINGKFLYIGITDKPISGIKKKSRKCLLKSFFNRYSVFPESLAFRVLITRYTIVETGNITGEMIKKICPTTSYYRELDGFL